jgi:hypothetical protein
MAATTAALFVVIADCLEYAAVKFAAGGLASGTPSRGSPS